VCCWLDCLHVQIVSDNEWFLRFHFLLHGQHHKFPLDKGRLVFPIVPALITSASLYAVLYALLPLAPSLAAMSGMLIGYIVYDLTHYYVHHGKPASGYFYHLREHHMEHHFRNQDSGAYQHHPLSPPPPAAAFHSPQPSLTITHTLLVGGVWGVGFGITSMVWDKVFQSGHAVRR
jgi:sterol desaturase/sphingolipid hydroxylase (fatty acid hydroxylase superfamily)